MVTSKTKPVEEKIVSILDSENVELVLFEHRKQGPAWVLRLLIDHPAGVTLDLCEKVSRLVSDYIDEAEPFEHAFNLEVSSPGIERPLVKPDHFKRFVGERIAVQLFKPLGDRKKLVGLLKEFTTTPSFTCVIENESDSEPYTVSLDQISKATLKPILDF